MKADNLGTFFFLLSLSCVLIGFFGTVFGGAYICGLENFWETNVTRTGPLTYCGVVIVGSPLLFIGGVAGMVISYLELGRKQSSLPENTPQSHGDST